MPRALEPPRVATASSTSGRYPPALVADDRVELASAVPNARPPPSAASTPMTPCPHQDCAAGGGEVLHRRDPRDGADDEPVDPRPTVAAR